MIEAEVECVLGANFQPYDISEEIRVVDFPFWDAQRCPLFRAIEQRSYLAGDQRVENPRGALLYVPLRALQLANEASTYTSNSIEDLF